MWEHKKKHLSTYILNMTCNGERGGMEVSQRLGDLSPASGGKKVSQHRQAASWPSSPLRRQSQTLSCHTGGYEADEAKAWDGGWGSGCISVCSMYVYMYAKFMYVCKVHAKFMYE